MLPGKMPNIHVKSIRRTGGNLVLVSGVREEERLASVTFGLLPPYSGTSSYWKVHGR